MEEGAQKLDCEQPEDLPEGGGSGKSLLGRLGGIFRVMQEIDWTRKTHRAMVGLHGCCGEEMQAGDGGRVL